MERFHSTLGEIARCLKLEKQIENSTELILLATIEYNKTIHTVTNKTPLSIFHSASVHHNYDVADHLKTAQQHVLEYHNKARYTKSYNVGDKVLVKSNRRLGNKLTPLYSEQIIEKDLGTTVLIRGRVVHKDNLRNNSKNL